MKTIIAGGRNYVFSAEDLAFLDGLKSEITEVVSGGASGADREGESWASSKGITVKKFPANWKKEGRAAGPLRNKRMAHYADAVILFPGGRGTESMKREANKRGLKIHDLRCSNQQGLLL